MLPCLKPHPFLQHRNSPSLGGEFLPQPRDGRILQRPERVAIGKTADLTEQVGEDLALVILQRKQCSPGCDPLSAKQPLFQLVSAWRALGLLIVRLASLFERRDPL